MLFIVFTTFPNIQSAENVAHALIENKLAACVQLIPGMTSFYQWEGKVDKSQEVLCI